MKHNQKTKWFLYGMLLGVVCFILVYGIKVLNFTNDSWIMLSGDQDIKQHYIGWTHFRNSSWGFPIGMIDSLSYPFSMSVIYTDSIPLFAVVFKMFSWALPDTFQYFGLFGLISFALNGGISALLIRRISDNRIVSIIAPVLFILSPIMLKRTFYHTSLSAQWIILFGIYLLLDGYAYKASYEQANIARVAGLICVGIHIYFIPIVAGLMIGAAFEKMLNERKIINPLWSLLKNMLSFCISSVFFMFILGAFFVEGGSENYGVGEFGANLNTFINPLGMSRVLPDMPLLNEFQYEGGAYLGVGMLLLAIVSIVLLIKNVMENKGKNGWVMFNYPMEFTIVIMCLVYLFFSISPVFSFNDKLLFTIPYTKDMKLLFGIFRSNGRFIWPVFYFIYLGIIKEISKIKQSVCIVIIIVLGVALQIEDLSKTLNILHNQYALSDEEYTNLWDKWVGDKLEGYKHFALFTDEIMIYQNVGYYASEHGLDMNRFYFARDIDEAVAKEVAELELELSMGRLREDTVYVMKEEEYKKYKNSGLHFYPVKYLVFGTSEKIDGLLEVQSSDLTKMGWK